MKRVLKWPKHISKTAAITALDVPTVRCSILWDFYREWLHGKNLELQLSGCVMLALSDSHCVW